MAYNWTTKQSANTNSVAGFTAPGQINNQGLHNMNGVHSSDLAQGNGVNGIGKMQASEYFSNLLLERKRFKSEDLVFANFASQHDVTKIGTINLRRYKPLKAHTVALVEGNPPRPDRASGVAITATTRQYGRYMEFTDLFELKVADPVISEYTKELADVANETIDLLAQAALLAEAQIFFPVASAATDKATLGAAAKADRTKVSPKISDLRIIALTMKAAKVGTIGGKFVVLGSAAVLFDLQEDLKQTNYLNYGQANNLMGSNTMLPDVFDLTFREAATAKTESVSDGASGQVMIHHTIVLGAKAYTKLSIAGNGGIKTFTKGLGSAGTLDPIDQRMTMGWKINALGFKVTDPDAVVDYMTVPSQADIISDTFDYVEKDLQGNGVTADMLAQEVAKAKLALDTDTAFDGTATDKPEDKISVPTANLTDWKVLNSKGVEQTSAAGKSGGAKDTAPAGGTK